MSELSADIVDPIINFSAFLRLALIPGEEPFQSQFGNREEVRWSGFVELMRDAALTDWGPTKAHAMGISSAIFRNDHRCAANVITSHMVFLDYDKGIVTVEAAEAAVISLRLPAVIWTTFSHRPDAHRFRVCVPLARPVDTTAHVECWHFLHRLIGVGADRSKVGPESGFYVPGAYETGDERLLVMSGTIPTSEKLKEIAPPEIIEAVQGDLAVTTPSPRASSGVSARKSHRVRKLAKLVQTGGTGFEVADPARNPLVGADALDLYRHGPGEWHHKLYGLMCSIAGRAKAQGIDLTADQLATLYGRIDGDLWYRTSADRRARVKDAERALAFVGH